MNTYTVVDEDNEKRQKRNGDKILCKTVRSLQFDDAAFR